MSKTESEHRNTEWRLAPGVQWAVTEHGVLVRDMAAPQAMPLGYPQAAIWDLLARGFETSKITEALTSVADISHEAAESMFYSWIDRWLGDKWLVAIVQREKIDG